MNSGGNGNGNGMIHSSKALWDLDAKGIETWIRNLAPGVPNTGGMMFPKRPVATAATNAAAAAASCDATPIAAANTTTAMAMQQYQRKLAIGNTLLANLSTSLACASSSAADDYDNDAAAASVPTKKKQKTDNTNTNINANNTNTTKGDVYQILDPSFAKTSTQTSELLPGAILSRMTLGGLVNAVSGVPGGVVDTMNCIPLGELENNDRGTKNGGTATTGGGGVEAVSSAANLGCMNDILGSAGNLTLKEVIQLARGLHRSVAAR